MVPGRIHNISDRLLPHLPEHQEALPVDESGRPDSLLRGVYVHREHRLGGCADRPYEPGSVPHLFPQTARIDCLKARID